MNRADTHVRQLCHPKLIESDEAYGTIAIAKLSCFAIVVVRCCANQPRYCSAAGAVGLHAREGGGGTRGDLSWVRLLRERLSLRVIAGSRAGGCARDGVSGKLVASMKCLGEHYQESDDARRRHRHTAASDATRSAT